MRDVTLTSHAIRRFVERFAGNLSPHGAAARLRRLLRRARFLRRHPGNARLYGLGKMRFVIVDRTLITVYRPVGEQAVPGLDGEHWRDGRPAAIGQEQVRARKRTSFASIRGTPPVGGLF